MKIKYNYAKDFTKRNILLLNFFQSSKARIFHNKKVKSQYRQKN